MRNITDSTNGRNSVYPPTEGLTFHPFIYMVPQYKCEDVLMIGFAGGTVAGLIRLFYGGIPITAVDPAVIEDYDERYGVTLIREKGEGYVKKCGQYDAVIIDAYDDGSMEPCAFVTSPEFVADVQKIARYIIVHAKESTDMTAWGTPLKVLSLNDSRFYYYMVYEIPTMPIR